MTLKLPYVEMVTAGLLLIAVVAGGVSKAMDDKKMDALNTRAITAEARLADKDALIKGAAQLADERAKSAEAALAAAQAAGKQNRAQAQRLLTIPTPAEADRCASASALVDSVITGERH